MITLHASSIAKLQTGINTSLSRLVIYSGEMPTVDANFAYNAGTSTPYYAQQLCSVQSVTTSVLDGIIRFATTPTPVTATATGTATWFVLYNSSSTTKCVLGTIGNQVDGTAPLILQSTDLVSGELINFIQLGIKLI